MIGQTLARYRILESLGEGGMGVVYRAMDPHLDREVALKVLPENSLTNPDRRARFRREALALSRLNHPGIGTVFDFDSQDDRDFLVMEFVPGATLAVKLEAEKLKPSDAVDLALQIAEALEAAHEQGVVHRDLKPANIMVTPRGRAKVLDFGLAKLREEGAPTTVGAASAAATREALTAPQAWIGTLGYMAPEQLLGDEVSASADVFALGVVLYQLTTGKAPFGAAGAAVVNEVLNQSPVSPRKLEPSLPRDLETLIFRCLEKKPARRPSAREVATELRRILTRPSTPTDSPRIESIAVLPLENLSRDADQEYFADGMTEALIADLARIGALRVISRTSAMRYKGVRRPLPEIARELGVDAVVEGSVMRAGDRVRITAQLIEAATDRHLWAERYERDVADVLGIQSEVAQAIAREVQVQLTQQERSGLARPRRVDPEAHELYLKGRYLWNRRSVEAMERALELFNRAIERDPTYAPAFSGLADCYNILADNNRYPPEKSFPLAKAAAMKALALDDHLAEAHTSLAFAVSSYDWDWEAADRGYRRAIELDRGYPTALQWYGGFLSTQGRFDRAIEYSLEAVRRDPLSFILYSAAGEAHYYARRYDGAVEYYHRGIELAPEFWAFYMDRGRALERAGRLDKALAQYQRGIQLSGADPGRSTALACWNATAGRTDEARTILAAMKTPREGTYMPPYAIASVHALLGETDAAIQALQEAFERRDRAMMFLKVNPRLDSLRGDPRFRELLRKMRLDT
jgi:serine/threonine protein kinase/tetratricopeptide (TPR) repeat protein